MQLTSRLPATQPATVLRQAALLVLGSGLLAAAAHVRLPFWPVPMTMQSFIVLMIGATYGARLAAATTLAYLLEGLIGLPVFSGSTGLAGPTGGYLIGFVVAATSIGYAVDRWRPRRIVTTLGLLLAADAALLACGFAWLATLIGPSRALALGILPFLPAEAFKILLATALLHTGLLRSWRR